MTQSSADELLSQAHSRTDKLVSALQLRRDDLKQSHAPIDPAVAGSGVEKLTDALVAAQHLGEALELIKRTQKEGA